MPQKVGGGGVTYALEASGNNLTEEREKVVEERRGNAMATLYSDGVLEISPIEGTDGKLDYIYENNGGVGSWFQFTDLRDFRISEEMKQKYSQLKIKKIKVKPGVTLTKVDGFATSYWESREYEEIDLSGLNITTESEKINSLINLFSEKTPNKIIKYKLNPNWDFSNVKEFVLAFVFNTGNPPILTQEDVHILTKNIKPKQINSLIQNTKIEHLDLSSFNTRDLVKVGEIGVFNNIQGLKKITFGNDFVFNDFYSADPTHPTVFDANYKDLYYESNNATKYSYDGIHSWGVGQVFQLTKLTGLKEVVMNGNENNGKFIVDDWIQDVLVNGKKDGVIEDGKTYALIKDNNIFIGELNEIKNSNRRNFEAGTYKIRPVIISKSIYLKDDTLEYGKRRVVENYSTVIDKDTNEKYNNTTTKNTITYIGTKPIEIEKQIELPITETQTDSLVEGKERITQGRPHIEKEITEYSVNETTGDITESKRVEIVDEGTPTVKEIGTREPNTIIRDVNGKDLTDDELPNYTNLEPNPTNTTDNGDLVYIVHKIITKYKGNDTLELNKQVVEKDGKTDGVKLIQVGTKPTVTTIERDNKQIKQTTTYIVNEDTGELTPNTTEEIIGNVKPTTSNGTESPLTYEIPAISTNTPIDENDDLILPPTIDKLEYTGTLSTNTPVDDDGELILPPTYHKEEYTQPLSTNTPVDKDDNLILPPTVEIPEYTKPISTKTPVDENGDLILPPIVDTTEYKDDIVNESQKDKKDIKEKLQPKESNKQEPTENTQKLDKQQDVKQDTVNTTESDNNNVVQKQTLPKTNALYISTPYVLGLLLSAIGLKHSKKD